MALRFQPYVSPETYLSYRDAAERRPDLNERIVQPLMQGIQLVQQGQQYDLAQKRQAMHDKILANEEARKSAQSAYEMGTPLNPNEMIGEPTGMMGQSSFMRGGQGPVGRSTPMVDAFNKFRSRGMPASEARPEYMGALGKDERKMFQEQFDPLKKAQASYYERRPSGTETKKYHFVDSSSKQMYDQDMNPISIAPEGSNPKIIGNPYAGSEYSRRDALSKGSLNSINKVKELLTDETLNELKAIKFTPGKMYAQIASPDAKEVYRNLYNAIANQLYLKTGATANPSEIENNMIMYMPAANENVFDMNKRLDMLGGESSLFATPSYPRNQERPVPNPSPSPMDRQPTKTIGGKTYIKMNGEWYEQ